MENDTLHIVMVGHVDHGKSTLIGRLVYAMHGLPDGKYEQIAASCARRGVPFEWAYLMDALQAERAQNITIDSSQFWLRGQTRDFVLIDAPGHHEFIRNMFTGASESDAALLLVDAVEGMRTQTRLHAYLLHLLGITNIIVVINKMDKVKYVHAHFEALAEECRTYLTQLGVPPQHIIPISAYHGDMIVEQRDAMPWYHGMTVVEALHSLPSPTDILHQSPLRLAVQDVYRFDARRIIAGTLKSGTLTVGDTVLISPHNYETTIEALYVDSDVSVQQVVAGQAVGVTFTEQRFIERGHLISHVQHPPVLANQLYMRLLWLDTTPLQMGGIYELCIHHARWRAEVKRICYTLDTATLIQEEGTQVQRHQIAEVLWHVRGLATFDDYSTLPVMGRAVVSNGERIIGGGLLMMHELHSLRAGTKHITSTHVSLEQMNVTADLRTRRNGHSGGIIWFTGLSGSGKSTLAKELQQHLFTRGYQVYVLDGDNVRHGLNSDLGFSPHDRTENIRRVGEVAALFADAGMIVITAFISPYGEDRRKARAAAPELFHTVYIKAGVEICEQRDVKGLYQKARRGEIREFTGVSAPYEPPEHAELILDTETHSIDECVEQLLHYIEKEFGKL
jgi:bifunctional enzyme CysN/CysC